jgi:hypothetical protein
MPKITVDNFYELCFVGADQQQQTAASQVPPSPPPKAARSKSNRPNELEKLNKSNELGIIVFLRAGGPGPRAGRKTDFPSESGRDERGTHTPQCPFFCFPSLRSADLNQTHFSKLGGVEDEAPKVAR